MRPRRLRRAPQGYAGRAGGRRCGYRLFPGEGRKTDAGWIMFRCRFVVVIAALTCAAFVAGGCELNLLDLPAPVNPELQARIVARRYMVGGYADAIDSTRHDPYVIYHWRYTQGVTLWALILLHEELGDSAYLAQVRASLESYDEHGRIRADGGDEPIDYIGAMAHAILEYSLRTDDGRFLDKVLEAARFFRDDAARTPEGLIAYHSDPERGRIWMDALFMVTPLMAKAGKHLGDESYYDDVLAQFAGFTERLRDPEVGLYHQGFNWHGPGPSPGYWGRANGWTALAMTEVLDTIPASYPGYDDLLLLYKDFASAITGHQGSGGMWHQLLNRPDSYEETSCTAMFVYALGCGVQRGWLADEYIGVVERGFEGLSRMISLGGTIENICPGTSTRSSEEAYFDRGPGANDAHGIGPVLLAQYAVMTLRDGTK